MKEIICPNCKIGYMKYFEKEKTYFCEFCGYIFELEEDLNKEKPTYIN